jgi:hypothetical protein
VSYSSKANFNADIEFPILSNEIKTYSKKDMKLNERRRHSQDNRALNFISQKDEAIGWSSSKTTNTVNRISEAYKNTF